MNWFQYVLYYFLGEMYINSNRELFNTSTASIVRMTEGNVRIHAFKPNQYVVSSYIIELPTKLVLIDFQLLTTDATNFLQYAQSLNKTIDRGYLTHYHFDHWAGVEVFKTVAPVYAMNESINQIRNFYVNGRDSPYKPKAVDFLGYVRTATLGCEYIDNVQFCLEKITGGENPFTMIIRLPSYSVLAVGDLVYNQRHVYVGELLNYNDWFSLFNYFLKMYPYRNILIGHGDPSGPFQIRETIDYLTYVRDIANNYKTLGDYRASILKKYPNYVNEPIINCPFTNLSCPYGIIN